MTELKIYLENNDISQRIICKDTGLSVSVVNRIVNIGKSTPSVKKLVYLYLKTEHKAEFTEKEYMQMLDKKE